MAEPESSLDPVAAVREAYDRWAAVYDHDANPLLALEEVRVRAAVGDVRGLAVLDLGCGTGRHAAWLAAAGATVNAVDFSEGMLAEARRATEGMGVRFLVHDLHRPLPFAGASFDLVVSGLVLEHLRDLALFFREARRVLRDDGRAVVSAMHPAMFLRGSQARFTDPSSGEIVRPGSLPHQLGDFAMAAVAAGFALEGLGEHAPDADLAAHYPRAEKYVGWPMLVVLRLRAAARVAAPPRPQEVGRGFRHLNLNVADLARSVEFYRSLFDLELVRDCAETIERDGAAVEIRQAILCTPGAGDILALTQADAFPVGPGGLNHLGYVFESDREVGVALRRAVALGAQIIREGEREQGGRREVYAYIRDPDGYAIELSTQQMVLAMMP